MTTEEKEKLKTYLILKHGSLSAFYSKWMLENIPDITTDERQVLSEWIDSLLERMTSTKNTCDWRGSEYK